MDVRLILEKPIKKSSTGIFIRKSGKIKELTISEVKDIYPNNYFEEREYETNEVFSANITHNLGTMASEAGIYHHLWRPEEINIYKAKELINPLREGLHMLKSDRIKFEQYNPSNGWGNYDNLVEFVQNYLDACYNYPEAKIEVSI